MSSLQQLFSSFDGTDNVIRTLWLVGIDCLQAVLSIGGDRHEEPETRISKPDAEAFRRRTSKSLSRSAEASRRSSKGRVTLPATKLEDTFRSEAARN